MQGKHIVLSAAGVLAAGVCWAGAVVLTPAQNSGADPARLREMAQRTVGTAPGEAPLPQANVPQGAEEPVAVAPRVRQQAPAPAPVVRSEPAQAPVRRASFDSPPQAPQVAAQRDDAVRNIALTGVTHQGGEDQALLLDLSSRERESVRLGGRAFGFTVRKIEPESVVLARGSDEYTVRLGDKQVPTSDASVSLASADDEGGFGGGFGRGRGEFGRGGRGGFGGFGGSDADRERRRAEFFSRFGGQFGGGRPSFANNSGFGGREAFTFDSGGRGDRGDRGGDRGRSNNWNNGGRSWNNGGGRSWNSGPSVSFSMSPMWGMGRGGSGQSQTSFTNAPTSNPQTARRRGGQVIGGGNGGGSGGGSAPQPINNPQTQRRLGTTSGPAFGEDQPSNAYGNRGGFNGGSNRSGNFGRGSSR